MNSSSIFTFIVPSDWDGQRLDKYLHYNYQKEYSRSELTNNILNLTCNNISVKFSHKVHEGDEIKGELKLKYVPVIKKEDLQIPIVFEDDYIIVINKPMGISTHPSGKICTGTVVNFLLHHIEGLENSSQNLERIGIVHRLDKDTSGILIAAKNDIIINKIQNQFKNRKIKKVYNALVEGVITEESGIIDKPIGRDPVRRKKFTIRNDGKSAQTEYLVLKRFKSHTLLEIKPITGRTHQIRVHLHSIHHPVCGDKLYTRNYKKYNIKGLCLCATSITFMHPISKEILNFGVSLPFEFKEILDNLI